jgi:tRNA(adenine34) deaminase
VNDAHPFDPAMREALGLAAEAAAAGEVPVGAVAVHEGRVVGRGRNRREEDRDPCAHAELLAIQDAARTLGRWRLTGVTLVVTLEPCAMCAGALVHARVACVVFGASDPKGGAARTLYRMLEDERLNHQAEVVGGVLEPECREMLQEFFRARRGNRGRGSLLPRG